SPCNVYGRARPHSGGHGPVIAGREDVREKREVSYLLQRLVAVRELEEIEVGVGHKDVLGLPTDPAAHIYVAVSRAGTRGVDCQADAGLALLAVSAAAAGDVERHGDDIANLYEL